MKRIEKAKEYLEDPDLPLAEIAQLCAAARDANAYVVIGVCEKLPNTIGTMYKQVNPFEAKKRGAALSARNIAAHIEREVLDKPKGWKPLVYCWRGGQRSGAFSHILREIGWDAHRLQGGYKAWRSLVVHEVYDTPVRAPMVVLDGNTGSAKTDVLKLLPDRGVQVLDLEGLANHRGSLFGGMGDQPSQKAFEGRLAMAIARLDPTRDRKSVV